jgi:pimeloyl-ACP methyl ester carboxylesterase
MEWLTGFGDLLQDWLIDCPSLFIRGANSDYVSEPEIAVIEQHFSNYRLETIEDAGHWLHAEQPAPFNRLVLEFLQAG